MKTISFGEFKRMPWKNGGGVTDEIARLPDSGEIIWRLSRARVEKNGPFSVFPGYDRLLVVLEGEGLKLNEKVLKKNEVFKFRGEEEIECELLSDSVTDLGLIFDRTKIQAGMKWIPQESEHHFKDGKHFLFMHREQIVICFEAGDRCLRKAGWLVSLEEI